MSATGRKCSVVKNVIVDAHVRAEVGINRNWHHKETAEDYGKRLESECRSFNEFIRDHRSQDNIQLSVELEREDHCSSCGNKWERYDFEATAEEAAYAGCASCGAELAAMDSLAEVTA